MIYDRIIDFYGRTLHWVLQHQTADAAGGRGHPGPDGPLVYRGSQRVLPGPGHRLIQGISEAPQSISFPAMAERQQALAKVILKDPAVESLSTFIGVDGTNTTLNSGRMLINLKPLGGARMQRQRGHPPSAAATRRVKGITLFMQPVQDLTVDDRVSRTQYQYTLEDPNADELNTLGPQAGGSPAGSCRNCAT